MGLARRRGAWVRLVDPQAVPDLGDLHKGLAVDLAGAAGQERLVLPLNADARHELDLREGHMVLEIKDRAVRVAFAGCDDQVCVRTGWVSTRVRPIICTPYRVLIAVQGPPGALDGTVR